MNNSDQSNHSNTSQDQPTQASEKGKNQQDILNSLRQLNSCITLTSVGNKGSNPASESESSGEEDNDDRNIPSALRGISIKGASDGQSLSSLLAKSKSNNDKLNLKGGEENSSGNSNPLSALRGVTIQGGNSILKDYLDKSKANKADSNSTNITNNNSVLAALRGVTVQGVKSNNGESKDDSESNSSTENNSPPTTSALSSGFRGVSITTTPVTKDSSQQDHKKEEDPGSNSSSAPSSPGIPSALKGISVEGVSKDLLLNNILGKSKETDNKSGENQNKWINEWSKRCLSISFSSENKEESDDEDKAALNDKEGGYNEHGTTPSPTPNSASNSRDSLPKSEKQNSTQEKISPEPPSEERDTNNITPFDTPLENQQEEENFSIYQCHICNQFFRDKSELTLHSINCKPIKTSKGRSINSVARKKTTPKKYLSSEPEEFLLHERIRKKRSCIHCGIYNFKSYLAFEEHHAAHIRGSELRVYLKRLSKTYLRSLNLDLNLDSDNSRESVNFGAGTSSDFHVAPSTKSNPEEKGLKLTFKISKNNGKGRKKTVKIINNQDMDENVDQLSVERTNVDSEPTQNEPESENMVNQEQSNHLPSTGSETFSDSDCSTSSQLNNFSGFENNLGFDNNLAPNERPPSTYQPQFESFPGDWFNEYESGSRIAAAMTGSTNENGEQNEVYQNSNSAENSNIGVSSSSYDSNDHPNANKEMPQVSDGDGLFSQAILGGECPPTQNSSDQGQGSFEQLCLNDSFNQQDAQSDMDSNFQQTQQFQQQGGNDLLSELAYLNNTAQQGTSPHSAEQQFSSRNSNSGTPTSSTGHQTPPASDTSFRALATSPPSPLNSGGPTPPLSGTTPPIPNATSPLQHISQMSQGQEAITTPRLTIANNLMPTTTSNSMQPVNTYNQQWAGANNAAQNFNSTYMQTPSISGTIQPGRPNTYAPMPMGYRPSPPPRIRGRPPLLGHVGRPPMIRGPGRPPGGTGMPLVPGRGGIMPNMRHPQFGNRGAMAGGQKRPLPGATQSPNKTMRREDINVPSRQKDNECQIIAVANRADGMPVISNVQGRDERAKTTESTIHLSDSITLSVRPNQTTDGRVAGRGEKGGDAGVVANLLASRGITVTPAAGEKEANATGREERRLPTASDLNLSSAISVHPPTSRDRDGFAVPHPPSPSRPTPTVNKEVERPPRPPTVDLTQDISPIGATATRLQCSQCDRSFPTQALLSDHAKIHQQQAQSRMPFKCHLCSAGFSTQKGQQNHYQNFHQLHLSPGDLAIPVVDFRNPVNIQRMARLGIRSFLPLSNLQNRGAGGVVGVPILTLENLHNGQMNMQQWGISDVLTLGPPKTLNPPR